MNISLYVWQPELKVCYNFILNNKCLADKLKRFLSMYVITDKMFDTGIDILKIVLTSKDNNIINIRVENIIMDFREDEIYGIIIEIISSPYKLMQNNQYIFLHGSLVRNSLGDCYGIIAPTMNGKTTVTALLSLDYDFTYYSDDIIIVDNNLNAYAYPTPIKLRKGKITEKFNNSKYCFGFGRDGICYLSGLSSNSICYQKNRIKGIIFLSRLQTCCLKINKVTYLEYVEKLMINLSYCDNMKNYIKTILKLAKETKGYECTYYNANDLINKLLEKNLL